ncbi:hypothetical protein LZ31DRAFT_198103 [Colletotrichum somersetense]|nr:hypothetical protein LZ31DRAFT_198103 [Colletotrichum somersetense]
MELVIAGGNLLLNSDRFMWLPVRWGSFQYGRCFFLSSLFSFFVHFGCKERTIFAIVDDWLGDIDASYLHSLACTQRHSWSFPGFVRHTKTREIESFG